MTPVFPWGKHYGHRAAWKRAADGISAPVQTKRDEKTPPQTRDTNWHRPVKKKTKQTSIGAQRLSWTWEGGTRTSVFAA